LPYIDYANRLQSLYLSQSMHQPSPAKTPDLWLHKIRISVRGWGDQKL